MRKRKVETVSIACVASLVLLFALTTGCFAQQAGEAEYRFWTTANGKRSSSKLKLVEQTVDVVKLQRQDNGNVVSLRTEQLSDLDRDYLAKRASAKSTSTDSDENWSRFRGPNGSGLSSDTGLPATWSDTQNVAWKTPLPGRGSSSPITWGDHIYLTAYTGFGVEDGVGKINDLTYHMLCFHRVDGKLLWDKPIPSGGNVAPYESQIPSHGYTTSTPCADESGVYAIFGPTGLARFSHDGELVWLKEKGDYKARYGDGASPILYKDIVLVHDVTGDDRTIGVNKNTGETIWRVNDMGGGWQTPILMETSNGAEMIISRRTWGIAGVNPLTGEYHWTAGNRFAMTAIPTPIHHGDTVFMTGGREGLTFSFKAGGQGKLEDNKIWELNKGSELSSPVYHDGHLYMVRDRGGIAYCINADTGELVYEERLDPPPSQNYASAVLGDGKIYYVSRKKGIYVVAAKPEFEQLARNTFVLDDSVLNATPAISRGQLLIRSDKFMYCIGKQ